ncbi:hypothetical protein ACVCNR_17800 (plasmid) [Aquamicrobium terrae]
MNLPSASVAQALPTTASTIFAARRISATEPEDVVIGWSSLRLCRTAAASGSSVAFLAGFGFCQFIGAGYSGYRFRTSYGNPCIRPAGTAGYGASRTGRMLACHFVGRGEKPEKPPRSSSLSRPVNTARPSNFLSFAAAYICP